MNKDSSKFTGDLGILTLGGDWTPVFNDTKARDTWILSKAIKPGRHVWGYDHGGQEMFLLPINEYEAQMRKGADFELWGSARVVRQSDIEALRRIGP